MGKKKDYLTRSEQEKSENYAEVSKDIPAERFQTKQQVVPAMSAEKVQGDNPGFGKKKVEQKGTVLKQEVAARVIDTGVGGETPEAAATRNGLSYGGNEGVILDSSAYTPNVGRSRSDSRLGKKQDVIAKKLNFIPSEQVEIDYDESKPLAEAKDEVQGYNGSPRNTNARLQKNVGAVPADLLFQRSLDEIKRSHLYFTTGQVVNTAGLDNQVTPTRVPELQANGVYAYGDSDNYSITRGNYLNRNMTIRFDANGKLTKMVFDTIDLSTVTSDNDVANSSSANSTIDMNYAELDRQKIDAKAGDEAGNENWSPLARAVYQPTRTVGYLRDVENITGSEVFMAYKKTAACFSYQLNKAAKDGMKLVTPMAEMLLGLTRPEYSSREYSNITTGDMFSSAEFKKGAASLFINIYDSIGKYNNKADVLIQPRSLKLALQTADNNMNPLRVKADFVKTVNSREVFSTIDREYDPTMPVCISDRAGLIHCYDFNDLYAFSSLDENGNPEFTKDPFTYCYADRRNSYLVAAATPLLRGLHVYLDSIGPKIAAINSGSLVNQDIVIPMIHSTCYFSLWSLFVLMATPYITRERINSMRDVLYYEKAYEYPFHQLITIREANPMNAVQYSNTDYNTPLVVKRMTPSCALSWVLPELFWPFDEKAANDTYSYLLPWYFNQREFQFNGNNVSKNRGVFAMSIPSVRSGVRFGYLDDIYGMSERDVRLSLDRLTDIPTQATGSGNCGTYKYCQNADGQPFITISGSNFTIEKFCSLPRELGWFMVAPAGLLEPKELSANTYNFADADAPIFGESSYIAKFWHGRIGNGNTEPGTVLDPVNINVSRNTAYKQDWDAIPATNKFTSNPDPNWGFSLSLADILTNDGAVVEGHSLFEPFTNGVVSSGAETKLTGAEYSVVSFQKALWTRIQKLPFAISPWDMRMTRGLGEDAIKVDPFDFLYYFGLCGFKASEYEEDVYNRSNEVLNQGFTFISDPWCEASPLFKEAGSYTQSDNAESLLNK